MASLNTKTKLYLEANSKTWDDTKVELQDDGSGPYISVWNYDGLAKPSDSKIAEYEAAGNAAETLSGVLGKRAIGFDTGSTKLLIISLQKNDLPEPIVPITINKQ